MGLNARNFYPNSETLRTEVQGDSYDLGPDYSQFHSKLASLKPRWYEKPKAETQSAAISEPWTRTDLLRKSAPEKKRVATFGVYSWPTGATGPVITPWYPGMPYSPMNPPVATGSRDADEPYVGPPSGSAFAGDISPSIASMYHPANQQAQALGQRQPPETTQGTSPEVMRQLIMLGLMRDPAKDQQMEWDKQYGGGGRR